MQFTERPADQVAIGDTGEIGAPRTVRRTAQRLLDEPEMVAKGMRDTGIGVGEFCGEGEQSRERYAAAAEFGGQSQGGDARLLQAAHVARR